MNNTVCKEHEWVDVKESLPDRNMKVRWLTEDGIEDIGFFYKDNKGDCFAGFDLGSLKEITHWKPFITELEPPLDIIEESWDKIIEYFINYYDSNRITSDIMFSFRNWLEKNYYPPIKK